MPECKQCGSEDSSQAESSGGLCKDCLAKMEDEKQLVEKKSAVERDEVRKNIDLIVKATTKEQPLTYTFICWDILEKKDSKLPGIVTSLMIGGPVGEMIFGGTLLSKNTFTYCGELGMIVVTESHILIEHFKAPFESNIGSITPDHLKLFVKMLDSKKTTSKSFDICKTYVSGTRDSLLSLGCGSESFDFKTPNLFMYKRRYELPRAVDIKAKIDQKGPLIAPIDFVAKLFQGEDPILERQFNEGKKDEEYIKSIFQSILGHAGRDVLVNNFQCMASPVRAVFEERIRKKAAASGDACVKLILWAALVVSCIVGFIVGIFIAQSLVCAFSFVAAFIAAIFILLAYNNMENCNWCQKIVANEFKA